MADLTFYSSVRRGATLAITRNDFTAGSEDHAQLAVRLTYDSAHIANTNLALVGPGDIVGLDTRCIVRMFPPPNENDGEAGFLCYVDFDQVDLPWRYTPAHFAGDIGGHTDRIRPWLTLLVLIEGTDLATTDFRPPQGTEKLPQLTVNDASLLPGLDEVWGWAHVQGQQTMNDGAIATALAGRPGALVGRLLSPRRLDPSTAYRAFLVPTFKRGVLAGQGKDLTGIDGLAPAWDSPAQVPLTLPVYHSWRFQTGTVSSFSEAARQLRPAPELPSTVGQRAIDVSSPGFVLTSPTGTTDPMLIGGALQTTTQATAPPPTLADNWVKGLGDLTAKSVQQVGGQNLRIVAPPLYGRWYAAEDHLDVPGQVPTPSNPPWFATLNKDPRYRVAGGLGTEVVQRDQQALMAAALDQGARLIDNVNRKRKVMQTGREVFTRLLGRHLNTNPLQPGSLFLVTSFLHGKVLSCSGGPTPLPTIAGILSGSTFGGHPHGWRRTFRDDPTGLFGVINSGGFIPKPQNPPNMSTPDTTVGGSIPGGLPDPGVGTIISTMTSDQRLYWGVVIFIVARRLLSTQAGKYWWLLRRLLRLGLDLIQLASTQGATAVTFLEKLRAGTLLGLDIKALPIASNFASAAKDPTLSDPITWPAVQTPGTGTKDSAEGGAFRTAAIALFDFVNGAPLAGLHIPHADVPSLVSCIVSTLSPAVTFVAKEQSLHVLTRMISWQSQDKLEPILLAPTVGFPMWQRLSDISVDWILPGAGDLPRNTASLLVTNQNFIEAFMVGLNHQMTRELLWNGYPTDQRGTYFQQFWDFRGWVKGDNDADRTEDQFADITPLKGWDRTTSLGAHTGRPSSTQLVLVVRGDVIKRYPNVVVYACPAVAPDPAHPTVLTLDDGNQRHPVFQAILTGDIAFYGFELSKEAARGTDGSKGYFFVLQEHPSEPKFNKPAIDEVLAHPTDYQTPAVPPVPAAVAAVAADVAAIAYEQPTRVAIHGKDLLPA